jgi:tetratricopeptide (TPR) repeat protein
MGIRRLRQVLAMALVSVAMLASSCSSGNNSPRAGADEPGKGDAASRVVFRDAKGRELTEADLAGSSGSFTWEVVGPRTIPPRAKELHGQGREAGSAGDHDKALALFDQAHQEAPDWPYPLYDAAYTYVLKGEATKAEEYYAAVDKMAPRGFFTARTALDCLRREQAGDVKAGTYKLLVMLEWENNPAEKKAILERIVKQNPKFPAAWKELALLQDDDDGKLKAIETGLFHSPDGETKGILLINKALTLNNRGKREEATRLLGELVLDPESTLGTEHLAKVALANLLKKS